MSGTILGCDLGGTRIKAALLSASGEVLAERTVAAPSTREAALEELARLHAELSRPDTAALGLAVPGLVDEGGIVRALPGKYDGIVGFDLPGWARDQLGLRAVVLNDAVAYGLGEALAGAGRGHSRVVVVTVGTGFGVTVVEAGAPVTGGPLGGGITGGNIPISEPDGQLLDTSGRSGTIEARCRAVRIVDYAQARGSAASTVPEVYAAAERGEPAASEGVADYRGWLARALTALASAHGPDCIVVGGGPAVPGAPWLPGLQQLVQDQLWPTHRVAIVLSELGDHAALTGLAQRAGSLVSDRPHN